MEKEQRTIREEMLLGEEAIKKLRESHVAVFGLGGVGSWCAEALARAGIGHLTLIDSDEFSMSNINRQLGALCTTVGRAKTEVMAERIKDISPDIKVDIITGIYNAENREKFLADYDFVADAIDLVSCKIDLILSCREKNIPMISALGTGDKKDATMLQITDISKTYNCALAKVMRKELRNRGINHHPVVFSAEEALTHQFEEVPPPGRRSVPGSIVWVPATAGLLMCQYIVLELTKTEEPA